MKRSLRTLTTGKKNISKLSLWLVTLLMVVMSSHLNAQRATQTECICLGNSSTATDGQFKDSIVVTTSLQGEDWAIVEATGLYSTSSAAPPAAPTDLSLPMGFTSDGTRRFIVEAIRQPGTAWTMLLVSESNDSLRLESNYICQNPSTDIIGDTTVCISENIEIYRLAAADPIDITWTITGGTFTTPTDEPSVTVDWLDSEGADSLSYTALAPAYEGQTYGLCAITDSVNVDRYDQEITALACNNKINISLNGNCDLNITADMILEDSVYTYDSYDLIFRDIEADTIVPGPMIGMEYINTTLEVSVVHECSGNSCWGYVVLEDKSIPDLICPEDVVLNCDDLSDPSNTGFPVPATATVVDLGNQKYRVSGFDMCSDVTLAYEDIVISGNLCTGPYSSIVRRRWAATDISGNVDTCSHVISVNRSSVSDITFPKHFDDVFYYNDPDVANRSIAACGDWPKNEKGYPSTEYTGVPTGLICMNVEVDYEDKLLFKCGEKSYKILREWSITDICDNNANTTYTQFITVMDTIKPVVDAPDNYTVGTGHHDCSSIIDVKKPTVSDCSSWDYEITYKSYVEGESAFDNAWTEHIVRNSDSTYTITKLPSHTGRVWINYIVTDACGNVGRDSMIITIMDDVEPTPVCDLHTYIGIGEKGYAYAMTDAFDDGSHDNCSVAKIEVRRMENSACGEISAWRDRVKFCCSDVGNVVMVRLRVTDQAGNHSECMVEAEVQDNYAPKITYCPADRSIDCDAQQINLSVYGSATAEDNCNYRIEERVDRFLNDCGTGTIVRTFIAIDDYDNKDSCKQVLTVYPTDPFYINRYDNNDPDDDVIWPENVYLENGCIDSSIHPDSLEEGHQRPVIIEKSCSKVSTSYRDVVFQYVDDACFKVLRTWTVLDHCTHNIGTGEGMWQYTQLIKIKNSEAPTFSVGCNVDDYTQTPQTNCTVRVQTTAEANDDCAGGDSDIEYSYKLDIDNNGSIDRVVNGSRFDNTLSFGTHKVYWYAKDRCGNVGECSVILNLKDNKAPTPYCITELVTVIMQENGQVDIWASDFDRGSLDDCGDNVRASFSKDVNDRSRTIKCADLDSMSQVFEYDVYFTDESGNQDFCSVRLIIQDNQNVCGKNNVDPDDETRTSRITLAGSIYDENQNNVNDVAVSLQAALPEFPISTKTTDGKYAFAELVSNQDYKIAPVSRVDYLNGVNTLDLVKIQRHILEMKMLESPYKVIGADINNDGKISATDLLALRKLILGIYDELPNNTSWRFVDAAKTFADAENPFGFEEDMAMRSMDKDYMDADFVAIKVGDMDGSNDFAGGAEASTRSPYTINAADEELAIGYNEIPFTLSAREALYGMQFGLSVNQDIITDIAITSDVFTINSENVHLENGKLYVSINEAIATDVSDQLFKLVVITNDEANVSDVISLDAYTVQPLFITEEGDDVKAVPFEVKIDGRTISEDSQFELFQNVPNPFASTTDIAFTLPSDQTGTLTIMDITGKVLYKKVGRYTKGYNVIRLDITDIAASGILHYQLDTDSHSANKKMIVIK